MKRLKREGCSFRLAHANVLTKQRKIPEGMVPGKDLQNPIARWETNVEIYEKAMGEVFPTTHRRMRLEDMCPERLRAHL